jgi:hypothetical protein
VNDINSALETVATGFAGPTDPAAFATPYCIWNDTGTGLIKQRNAANTTWVPIAPLLSAMAAQSQLIGVGQSWQNMIASRALNTVYTNSTGKPIFVSVTLSATSSATFDLYVSGLEIAKPRLVATDGRASAFAIVPDGSNYSVSFPTGTLTAWVEFR